MSATAMLRDQHVKILKVADILEEILSHEPEPCWFDFEALEDCLSFIRLYADALHHGKEETLLFTELTEQGLPSHTGPIAVMLEEHRRGRALVREVGDALPGVRRGDQADRRRMLDAGLGYISLIRGHILKEDNVLFEMADQLIPEPACRRLCDAYEGVCARHFEGRTVAELERLLAQLVERYPDA